ncbi:Lrp/AsnC family transcriptional regulator [Paralcaligenes ureilyticus]|uniref:AsnC family transcriptional regulator n=1 Tax=Paralcaligenes ureilyticus TaxID=627131 RepID=A0A4R3MDU8_9BURK|nr:Lrp/AsnC family transcriptional regulator [Paralcaligenes ureilyticus]TCT10287.1 AsnC family transcriptional regulator [Paralcaligenes ureilyticus]
MYIEVFSLNSELDHYDSRILAELQSDARISMAELGRRVHLSQPAVTERVRKLESSGVITGYRATVNVNRLGYGIRAVMRVSRAEYARVVKLIGQTPEVINAYNITGEDSWLLEIAVIDVAHLDAVVTKFCILTETSTAIILNAARENYPILPARQENVKPLIKKTTTA